MVQNCSRFSATRVGLAVLGGGGRWGSAGSHPWQPESKCHRLLGTSAHEKSVEHC